MTTSTSVTPVAKNWFDQLNLTDDVTNSFILDSKDFVTFLYTNTAL